ncbi:MAG: 1-deoxy-D-xylulose-5-phosphate reductoisomerase [Deltaproteobacteria bacterium]|nr:1-deoxy-D-xylulose-5-phosphate reductoisomerase [Deltaproteobacteria bacterium]
MNNIALFGSTGSIGKTTLSIIKKYPDLFRVEALAAGRNINLFKKQIRSFSPRYASVIEEKEAVILKKEFPKTKFFWGQEGLNILAMLEGVDLIVMAILGLDALMPTYLALKEKKKVALASKEVMVAGGRKIKEMKGSDDLLIPVDSEHSAIYQLLHGVAYDELRKILLTASGGPFLRTNIKDLKSITPRQALKHPKWKMGKKITIDSATMMNKGLEMIEARWLFNLNPGQIDVIIHPESIIHSMIELADGAVLAQMGVPDMRLPIAYAMNTRKRINLGMKKLDFKKIKVLNFILPDLKKFKCLKIAMDVIKQGDDSAIVMNAANDRAVEAFLENRIAFTDIADVVEYTLNRYYYKPVSSVYEIMVIDREVKKYVDERIQKLW